VNRSTRWRRRDERTRGSGISDLTTQRLSIYLHCLEDLLSAGVRTISSQGLAERFQLNSAQIRKDLACFGEFGVRGVGYVVADLKQNLTRVLGLTRTRKVLIVGAGNLGMALADYGGFNRDGFSIVALFDNDRRKIGGVSRGGVPVLDIRTLPAVARRDKVSIAVLAVPAAAAQKVLDLVGRAGIRAVLNFAPTRLKARAGLILKAVDLKIQLENLVFHLARAEGA
jgi:redox-sensing transcriptional repressor